MIKAGISNGFYRLDVNPDDIPKLGVAFWTDPEKEPLIAFLLVLPMGWKNSPPIFSTATETITDIANARIRAGRDPPPHWLDSLAESITSPSPLDDEGGATLEETSVPPPAMPKHQVTHPEMAGKAPLRCSSDRDSIRCDPTTALDTSQVSHRKEPAGGVAPLSPTSRAVLTTDKTVPQAGA